ncbi:MAG: hypothetical protein PHE61_07410 [Candidatus Omnitrophica bacterium]|nr:hypothetical protein [Candidatus Omnitrophota bacterium]
MRRVLAGSFSFAEYTGFQLGDEGEGELLRSSKRKFLSEAEYGFGAMNLSGKTLKILRHLWRRGSFFLVLAVFLGVGFLGAEESAELVVATFDRGEPPNEVGGNYGAWNYNVKDPSQHCYAAPEPDDPVNPEKGYSIRLDYDVLSKQPAFNGFWMGLGGIDISDYDTLSFWVKGDEACGFTTRFKLELKNAFGEKDTYCVRDIGPEWKEVTLDIKKDVSQIDWSNMTELVIVFDDIMSTKKTGSVCIDHFVFRKSTSSDLTEQSGE